jgi:hypothetical protein
MRPLFFIGLAGGFELMDCRVRGDYGIVDRPLGPLCQLEGIVALTLRARLGEARP